jgi:hypothetical protein
MNAGENLLHIHEWNLSTPPQAAGPATLPLSKSDTNSDGTSRSNIDFVEGVATVAVPPDDVLPLSDATVVEATSILYPEEGTERAWHNLSQQDRCYLCTKVKICAIVAVVLSAIIGVVAFDDLFGVAPDGKHGDLATKEDHSLQSSIKPMPWEDAKTYVVST